MSHSTQSQYLEFRGYVFAHWWRKNHRIDAERCSCCIPQRTGFSNPKCSGVTRSIETDQACTVGDCRSRYKCDFAAEAAQLPSTAGRNPPDQPRALSDLLLQIRQAPSPLRQHGPQTADYEL